MPSINDILGEERAMRVWRAAYGDGKKAMADVSVRTAISRIIADHETAKKALVVLIDELRDRVRRLERETHGVKWAGTWRADAEYAEGSLVTDRGALWLATISIKGTRPADGGLWKLIVKRGEAG